MDKQVSKSPDSTNDALFSGLGLMVASMRTILTAGIWIGLAAVAIFWIANGFGPSDEASKTAVKTQTIAPKQVAEVKSPAKQTDAPAAAKPQAVAAKPPAAAAPAKTAAPESPVAPSATADNAPAPKAAPPAKPTPVASKSASRKNAGAGALCDGKTNATLDTPLNCFAPPPALDAGPSGQFACPAPSAGWLKPGIMGITTGYREAAGAGASRKWEDAQSVRHKIFCELQKSKTPLALSAGTYRLRFDVTSAGQHLDLEFDHRVWAAADAKQGVSAELPDLITLGGVSEIRRRYWTRTRWTALMDDGVIEVASQSAVSPDLALGRVGNIAANNPIITDEADLELVYKPCQKVVMRQAQVAWLRNEFNLRSEEKSEQYLDDNFAGIQTLSPGKVFCLAEVVFKGAYKDKWSEHLRISLREGICTDPAEDIVFDGRTTVHEIEWNGLWHDKHEWLFLSRNTMIDQLQNYFPEPATPRLDVQHNPVRHYYWSDFETKSGKRVSKADRVKPTLVKSWEDWRVNHKCSGHACRCPVHKDEVFVELDVSYKPTSTLLMTRGVDLNECWEWKTSRQMGKSLTNFQERYSPLGGSSTNPLASTLR